MGIRKTTVLFFIIIGLLVISCVLSYTALKKADNSLGIHILLYYDICEDEADADEKTVTAEKLENDLAWISSAGYKTILPYEILSGAVKVRSDCVMLTFDGSYQSYYEILYPLLQKYEMKAVISVIGDKMETDGYLTWDQAKEMYESGLVEIGSASFKQYNNDTNGEYVEGQANGLQRKVDETKKEFDDRVEEDVTKTSYLIERRVGKKPITYAYPFGAHDKWSEKAVNRYYKFTMVIDDGQSAGLAKLYRLTTREEVTMGTSMEDLFSAK